VLEKSEIGMKRKGTFLFIAFVLGFLALIGQLTYIVFVEGKNYNLAVLH
jgi:cell division protein FtsI/penicillin-binding protein 2